MVFAKKSLGQNFLTSERAFASILKAGNVTAEDIILEIGPGRGALTDKLLQTRARVIAIEKDRELIPYLEEKFDKETKNKQLTLIEGDILELNMSKIIKAFKLKSSELLSFSYKLIANIPYYITGEIIRKFFEEKHQPERMVLLVQKEVAERIVARDGKESILSIACKAYSTPRYVEEVKRGSFVPAPNVDSAIILFEHISKDIFTKNHVDENQFFEVVKSGFAHKRKKLGGNLKELAYKLNPQKFETIKNARAETLSREDWIELLKVKE